MDDLEERVKERTQEIAQQKTYLEDALARLQEAHAQLLQADKMASIGQLAAGVAHEINNPIGFISSNLNSLSAYVEGLTRVLSAHEKLLEACVQGGRSEAEFRAAIAAGAAAVQQLRAETDHEYVLSDLVSLIAESVEGTQRVRQIVADLRDFSHIDAPDVVEEDLNKLLDRTINVAWNELKYKTTVVREYGQIPPPCPVTAVSLGRCFSTCWSTPRMQSRSRALSPCAPDAPTRMCESK